ncbi:flagellar hook-associated protein FlgK [Gluconobacter thailandicus F149-1 = NBRC 100600]|uniref:Flagellar hook-associated protein 1 n=1 Tax=Gluconobacter thailandicus NBRC 3257 TaxID=1381097 RepID=A0ABQ0IVT1_GLUTH|nr:flagellar hook-associated protein FlgK [Gluconobacter thailandicus]KXV53461.1 flagellar biosynthesis protein FlgK [Gluconobacter thailandicus]GAC87743.1 flagellar hook-associated protein 1 FlgK [Gluconobacter thailandicus NBRC 3255]GAD26322.1 flagellar hook-associated protein 1 FlgK [Gluconobacter thailandicus NBRC 3257]GAN92866.1 flagellar hook-associated protein FlgK [Gluconobacter thailandicus F149-1 = NBRC 100600]GBR61479.1 flagellar hook-associated protein FlgK [Gluconobacter thailandi
MGLTDSLSIAVSGLQAVQYGMSTASQNVANASTGGYIKEVANVQSVVNDGTGGGVRRATTTLASNTNIQAALYLQNADVAEYTTTSNSLSAIMALQGSTSADSGSSGTLSDQLGNLQSALTSLTATSSSSTAQSTVVAAASSFAQSINSLAEATQTQRQNAQDGVLSSVADINTNLTTIGNLSTKIMTLKSQGLDTADLENQRYTALSSLSSDLSVSWKVSANGDMSITASDGLTLPTHNTTAGATDAVSSTWPLTTSSAQISTSMSYPGASDVNSIPAITLNGKDITGHLTGGTLGANITLRDTTLPTMQAQLDSLAYTAASRFSAQGMTLFTTSDGSVPGSSQTEITPSGSIGFAQDIQVSQAYQDDPSLLVSGETAGTSVIQNVLSYAFGTTQSDGSSQTAAPSTGLGMTGQLSTGYSGSQSLIALATSMTANQAATANTASSNLSLAQTTQSSLSSSLSGTSSVSVDTEMANIVTLQNAYSANAKVISSVQTMFTALLNAVGS